MSKIFNTTNKKIILGVILLVVIIGGSYGVYSLYFTPEPTEPEPTEPEPTEPEPTEPEPTEPEPTEPEPTEPEPTEPEPTEPEPTEPEPHNSTVTVVDVTGVEVNVTKPVERIVALIGAEFICALGCEDKIVGRVKLTTDEEAILPPSVLELPVVGDTDYTASLEMIVELNPDLVLASQRLSDENREALEDAGIAVLEESTTFPRREAYLQNLALILDAEEEANLFLDYEAYYEDLVKESVANLTESEKPTVFFEWYQPWYSSGENGSYTEMIVTAGGINIAGDQPVSSMELSPEFVAEANPDMIVRMLTFYDGEELADYQALYDDFLNRTALSETTAVTTEQVYIIKNTVLVARRPIGLLYLAKWFHPDLFTDIDPAAIHEEYVQTFFGTSVSGVFVYPEETVTPEPPEPLTFVDGTGAQVNITLPVNRIISVSNGLTEIICTLDGEDKIVGRDASSVFPPSISEKPEVGESSYNLNLEPLLELEPDVVFSDGMMPTELREQIESADVPVWIENTNDPERMKNFTKSVGLLLGKEEKANEIVDYIEYYEALVEERVANITESEKPLVYFEWGGGWSCAAGTVFDDQLEEAGGINMAANSSTLYPTLNAEYIIEGNPEIILRSGSQTGCTLEALQELRTEVISRDGYSEVQAVIDNKVYLYDSQIGVGIRRVVGLLYWAKWFHPSLFADIDPAAVHEEMLQDFFDLELEGVYAYPEIVTVVDGNGAEMTINLPVERIVSINSGLTEILSALGCEDRIVGRDQSSTLPPSVLDIPVVAENSYAPNVELILETEPDILFADSMLPYNVELYEQLQAAGLTIFIADPSDPEPAAHANETAVDFSCKLVTTISRVVGAEEIADEYITYVQYYNNLVKERIENLTVADKPKVLLEWYAPYNTFVTPGLDQAGGVNIAENQTEYAPVLSAEFVVEQNPDIIIRAIQSLNHDEADFIDMQDEIMSRPELSEVTAVVTGQVYIYDWAARGGIRCVVGYLYWAKWCQPDLFADIDPAAVNTELDQMFFGIEIPGVYAYP
jgi:iron complex transport system substrate-binding protein